MGESIQYKITRADCMAATRLRLRPARVWTIALLVALLPFALFTFSFGYEGRWHDAGLLVRVVLVGLALLLVPYAAQLVLSPLLTHHGFMRSQRLGGSVVLTWDEGGFHVVRAGSAIAHAWQDIRKVRENRRLLLLHLGWHAVHLVPKAAFHSAVEAERFKAYLSQGAPVTPWHWALRIGLFIVTCFLAGMFLYVITLILVLGDFAASWSRDEVARVTSPSSRIDAVLYETNGGATTEFGYEVWIVPRGGSIPQSEVEQAWAPVFLYGAIRNDRAYGANLHWESADVLAIEYLKARSVEQNLPEVRVSDETVRIDQRPGVEDLSARGGGMLHHRGRELPVGR